MSHSGIILLFICTLSINNSINAVAYSTHIILDPAGDKKDHGRQLATSFERGIALQCCQALQEYLQANFSVQVTITRAAGEALTQEQRAQICNQLHANCVIHISFFQESETKPRIILYRLPCNTELPPKKTPYTITPLYQAHSMAYDGTTALVTHMHHTLPAVITSHCCIGPYNVPDMRLRGITIPACTLEIGLHAAHQWVDLIAPLAHAIATYSTL
jgi:hypothetical protein